MTAGPWRDRVDSTLDVTHAEAAAGAPDGAWIAAREQADGRGSRGRTWHSPAGGLWLSVLRRPPDGAQGVELASLRTGLSVRRTLAALLPDLPPIRLKWPNDLLVDDRKVGGILVEARWQGARLLWVAIGIGINVRNSIPAALRGQAAALAEWCPAADPVTLAAPVAEAVAGLSLVEATLSAAELREFRGCDWLAGRGIRGPVPGTGDGLDPDGRLRIRDAAGAVHRLAAGETLAL